MRPHAYVVTAGSMLLAASAASAGCAGNAAPPGEPAPSPAVVTSSPTPTPSPTVTLREPHSLVLNATGTAAVTSVVYELDGRKTTDKTVKLPWRKVVEVPADGKRHGWSLTLKHRSGKVELVALFDGSVTGRTRGSVVGNGSGTASVGGDVRG